MSKLTDSDTPSDLDVISRLTPEGILLKLYEKIDKNNRAINKKLHKLDKDSEAQRTLLNTVLPRLATHDQVKVMFGEHVEECREKRKKSSDRVLRPNSGEMTGKQLGVLIGKITALITALGGGAYGVKELLEKLASG